MPACAAAISARASCDSRTSAAPATSTSRLVEVGGERLGAPLVLAEQQVAARLDVLDHAFVAGRLPAHAVADDAVALLAARVAQDALALGRFDHEVAAVGTPPTRPLFNGTCDQPVAPGNASTLAAQMKSLIEMPPTEWVLKRTTQRL